jgi:uncharacterized membrane protein (Fun14 family)
VSGLVSGSERWRAAIIDFNSCVHWAGVLSGWWCWRRRALLLQLLGTLIVLGWVPGNVVKLAAIVVFWMIGFGSFSLAELAAAGVVNLLFILMDEGALRQGIFQFRHPDVIGLPAYEFFIWGFYILNAVRFVAGPTAHPRHILRALGLAVVFSLCFSMIDDPSLLAAAAGAVLAVSLVFFHEPGDYAFTIYMAAMGLLVEYVGVGAGQWTYPYAPDGGVPLWSFVMWGGIGLFTRRLLVPLLRRAPARPEDVMRA